MSDNTTITEKTKLPLSSVRVIVGGVIAAACIVAQGWWMIREDQIESRNMQRDTLREIRELKTAAWTRADMFGWTYELKIRNPNNLNVPIVSPSSSSEKPFSQNGRELHEVAGANNNRFEQ